MLNPLKIFLVAVAATGLALGFLLPPLGFPAWQGWVWGGAAGIVLLFLAWDILSSLLRGSFGLDLVAALSMSLAIWFGETLAACVVALMYAGGEFLENFAETRARSEMKALLGRVPKVALSYRGGHLVETPISDLKPGDRLLVRQGETVPVDGHVSHGSALLDQAVLTGESVPVRRNAGDPVLSGSTSLDMAFDMVADKPAAESTYSGIVRLVQAAQDAKAPMVRLADRFALAFMAVTLGLAGITWAVTQDHLRMLAVIIAATPCPLILAVPVAVISGISKAARRGVLLKGGPVLETLARAQTLVIDKTGTLTQGAAQVMEILPAGKAKPETILRLAASLDQASGHVIAASLVAAAHERGLELASPTEVHETGGEGVAGRVDGHEVIVGRHDFVRRMLHRKTMARPAVPPGSVIVAVAVDGKPAGHLVLADAVRPDAAAALQSLRQAGVSRIVLASGDHRAVVEKVGGALGLDALHAELDPSGKVAIVVAERKSGVTLMAGDGVNDAPALAVADVGISMGAHGSPAAAEAADAVLLADDLKRIGEAVGIARRSRAIALQSVYVGLGLSLAAMLGGAFGYVSVVEGALAQELIDVAVILNALRALR